MFKYFLKIATDDAVTQLFDNEFQQSIRRHANEKVRTFKLHLGLYNFRL